MIDFPKILNANDDYYVKLKTISLYNRIRTELNSIQLTITTENPIACNILSILLE